MNSLAHSWRLALAILSLSLLASPLWAQEKDPLAHIPFDCNLVVKLSSPEATVNRIREILSEASSDLAEFIDLVPATMEDWFFNSGMAGVDSGADVWMAVRFRSGHDPERAFIVVASDSKELMEAVGETFTFYTAGKWTVYSESPDLIELFRKLGDSTGRGLNKFVDPHSAEILTRGDLAVWVDLQSVRKAYQDELDALKADIETRLEELPQNMPSQGNIDPEQIAKTYSGIFESSRKILEDSRAFCGNVVFSKGGVLFDNYLSFSYSSETVKMLKTLRTSDFRGIEKLPQSHLIYYGVSGLSDQFMKWSTQSSAVMISDDEMKKKFNQASEILSGLGFGDMTASIDIGAPEEGMLQTVSQVELDDPKKMREATQQLMAAIGEIDQNGLKMKSEIKPEEEEYAGHKADVLTMTFEIDDPSSPQGMIQQQMMNSMYGPEGMKTRTFYFKDRVLQVMGSQDLVNEAIDTYVGRTVIYKSSGSSKKETETFKSEDTDSGGFSPPKSAPSNSPRRRRRDDSSAMFMLKDDGESLLVAQLGGGRDDDSKGRGLKIKSIPAEQETPATENPESDSSDAPETPPVGNPEQSITVEKSFDFSKQIQIPADNGPQEIPKRSVTDAIKMARGKLSPKSNVLLLIDLPTLIAKSLRRFPIVAAFGLQVSKFVKAAEEPSFTGISLAAEGNAFRFRVSVPSEQLKGIGEIVSILKPMSDRLRNGEGFTPPPPPPQALKKFSTEKNPGDADTFDPAESNGSTPEKTEPKEKRPDPRGKDRD